MINLKPIDKTHLVASSVIEHLNCIICDEFVQQPRMCKVCQQIFCKGCITGWLANNTNCPFKCMEGDDMEVVQLSGSLKLMYDNVEKRCSMGCGQTLKIKDAIKHELKCGSTKCGLHPSCEEPTNCVINGFPCCSEKCAMYGLMKQGSEPSVGQNKEELIPLVQDLGILLTGFTHRLNHVSRGIHSYCYWDPLPSSPKIKYSSDLKSASNVSTEKGFTSVVSKVGFCDKVHLVEFLISTSPTKPVKVGMVTSLDFRRDQAFSDQPFGYSFYTLGQLRNGDGGKGQRYSSRIEEETFQVAILINLIDGSLSFMVNGINQGFAFVQQDLKGKTVYPAVALREGSKVTIINHIATFDEIVV